MQPFDFRIIPLQNGNDIIDRNLLTPVESLDGVKLMEYIEIDKALLYSDRQKKRKMQNKKSFADHLVSAINRRCSV